MRALAHPARLEILEQLSLAATGATATECAERIGLSPSATSYHLRALAKVGLIIEAPGRGDGRERVWQATSRGYSVSGEHEATPEQIEAERLVTETMLARQNDRVRQYMARSYDEPREWFDVVTITDTTLQVTSAELAELLRQIDRLVEPLRSVNRDQGPAGSRRVSLQLRAVPVDELPG